jgi:hypothetical protein
VSARAGASDQVAEASVQIASSASAPEANGNAGLHPANGLLATVFRTTRFRQRVNPTRQTWPGKKPPARKANHAVSSPDRVTSGPRWPKRTNVGLTRRPLVADNRRERGNESDRFQAHRITRHRGLTLRIPGHMWLARARMQF